MLVGIGYNFQAGKDTSADALCRDLNYRKVAFADKLREFAMKVDPLITSSTQNVNVGIGRGRLAWAIQGLGYEEAKRTYPEVRTLLQKMGVAARELFGHDFWVDQALRGIKPEERVVFPDVRFENEAEAIKNLDGVLIKIVRPGFEGDGHESERALDEFDGWDYVVVNDGDVMDLQRKVVETVRKELASRDSS